MFPVQLGVSHPSILQQSWQGPYPPPEAVERYEFAVDEVSAASLPSAAADLLQLMKDDPLGFNRMISHNSHEPGKYTDVTLLQYIPADDFAARRYFKWVNWPERLRR